MVDVPALFPEPGVERIGLHGGPVLVHAGGQLVQVGAPELAFALLEPIVPLAAKDLVVALEGAGQAAENVLEVVAEQEGEGQGFADDGRAAPLIAPREAFAEAALGLVFDDALEDALGHGREMVAEAGNPDGGRTAGREGIIAGREEGVKQNQLRSDN